MAKNNYFELDKVTLITLVDKALQQSSKRDNINQGLKFHGSCH